MKTGFLTRFFSLYIAAAALFQLDVFSKDLQVYWVDVEGGAGTLIVTPAGESILIDTGMPGGRDPGRIVQVAKERAGLTSLDHLVVTHMHIDHFGGAAEIAKALPIAHVHDNGIPEQDPDGNTRNLSFPLTIKPYREMQVGKRSVVKPGDELLVKAAPSDTLPVSLRVVAAKQKIQPITTQRMNKLCESGINKAPDTSDNANSIVLILQMGEFRMFIGGDLTWNVESTLVCPSDVVGRVSVYQVNHHGLDVSNNPVLVNSMAPVVAVMSNGTSKGCGPETFKTLKALPGLKAVYQIHKNLRQDQNEVNTQPEMIANLAKECQAYPIHLKVMADGKQFEVSIPDKGHKALYPSR